MKITKFQLDNDIHKGLLRSTLESAFPLSRGKVHMKPISLTTLAKLDLPLGIKAFKINVLYQRLSKSKIETLSKYFKEILGLDIVSWKTGPKLTWDTLFRLIVVFPLELIIKVV